MSVSSAPIDIFVLEPILILIAQLDRKHLEQLYLHLADLLELLPSVHESPSSKAKQRNDRSAAQRLSARPSLKKCPPDEILDRQQKQTDPLLGINGGGYIEWKWIRKNGHLYGPYPYWRFNLGTKRCSIYLKQIAQEQRQRRSSISSAKPKATNA